MKRVHRTAAAVGALSIRNPPHEPLSSPWLFTAELRVMRRSPSIVPQADDREMCLVLNDYGDRLGRAWAEVPQEDTGGESVIRELMTGQYSGPVRIIAFNTAERWSRDVSEEIAEGV